MIFDVLTLFPDMVQAVTDESILGRAARANLISVRCHNIRDYSENKHHNVDDTPYGGGFGMVMAAPPVYGCWEAVMNGRTEEQRSTERVRTLYMSPKGRPFTQEYAARLARDYDRLILLCGHYEGVDQRVLDEIVDEDVTVGDYVLTGGELPACTVIDAVSRLIDGVLADPLCHTEESIASGLLEYPQYTRPAVFHGKEVPPVLLSGDHKHIAEWRLQQSLALTEERRPALYHAYVKETEEKARAAAAEKERLRRERRAARLAAARQETAASAETERRSEEHGKEDA